jgi:hypothetical protein
MSVENARGVRSRVRHTFLLTLGDGAGIDVAGRVVYSRAAMDADRRYFLSGIQFVDMDEKSPETPVSGWYKQVS